MVEMAEVKRLLEMKPVAGMDAMTTLSTALEFMEGMA